MLLCYILSRYVTPCYVKLCSIMLSFVMLHFDWFSYAMLCDIKLYYIMRITQLPSGSI